MKLAVLAMLLGGLLAAPASAGQPDVLNTKNRSVGAQAWFADGFQIAVHRSATGTRIYFNRQDTTSIVCDDGQAGVFWVGHWGEGEPQSFSIEDKMLGASVVADVPVVGGTYNSCTDSATGPLYGSAAIVLTWTSDGTQLDRDHEVQKNHQPGVGNERWERQSTVRYQVVNGSFNGESLSGTGLVYKSTISNHSVWL